METSSAYLYCARYIESTPAAVVRHQILQPLMERQAFGLSLATFLFFFFFSDFGTVKAGGRLLPIVNDNGGNATATKVYIVHVQKPNGTMFLSHRERTNWYRSFLPNTSLDSGEPRLVYAYHRVMSGFAARLTGEEAKAMESMEGFVYSHPERVHILHTTRTPQYLKLNERWDYDLWAQSNFGAGKIIGVIDSGIDPDHPSFGDAGVPPPPPEWNGTCYAKNKCNNKLIGMRALRHGHPNPNPYDDNGHGTHVASTAAGNFVDNAEVLGQAMGRASGTAPLAHLAIYKVLYDHKGQAKGFDADILAGIEWAIRDGVHILQMSLGLVSLEMYDSVVAKGSFAAMKNDIFPCAAAANEGPFISMIANDAPWILTVGASSTDRRIVAAVTLGDGQEFEGESAYQPENFTTGQLPIVYPGATIRTDAGRGCVVPLRRLNVKDKLVICWATELEKIEAGKRVKNAGGSAMILINAWWSGNTTSPDAHVLPASNVGSGSGEKIISYFNSTTNPTASITFKSAQYGTRPNPLVASFSSRGPSLKNYGIIKPDILAPGENILGAWPKNVGPSPTGTYSKFNFLSGTSMATPHVSGIVALLMNVHKGWSPARYKSALMTSTHKMSSDGEPIHDECNGADSSFTLGSGHVNPLAAVDPGLVYDLHYYDYVHYLCGAGMSDHHVSSILQSPVQCSSVKGIPVEQLNYPTFIVFQGPNKTTVRRVVTNVGEPDSTYQVEFIEPKGVNMVVSPSTLQFTRTEETQSFEVTFSISGVAPKSGKKAEGLLSWVSPKRVVWSNVVVTFV